MDGPCRRQADPAESLDTTYSITLNYPSFARLLICTDLRDYHATRPTNELRENHDAPDGVRQPCSQIVILGAMTCSRCSNAERIPGQRWCRRCLSVYAGERRARLKLERRAPELLTMAREAIGQVRTILQGLGAWSQPPQCCRDAHFRYLPCDCVCHGARAWLESRTRLVDGTLIINTRPGSEA
jgi:hypothetical protein